jgi:hypothetical protein
MTGTDNSRFLTQAAARRRQVALAAANAAIERLDRDGHPVNFCAVAQAAGVSRAWLYRQPDLRDLIARLRTLQPRQPTVTPTAQRASSDSLRQRLDTTRAELTRLRAENVALHEQIARHLGQQRARPDGHQPINPS